MCAADTKSEQLLARDREVVWHPYASMTAESPVFPVASASGVRLGLTDGRELIDGMASWWCAIHGYNHPVLNDAITRQLRDMAHVMFGGLTHEPAVALAEELVRLTPEPLQTVFLADSGSVSVEVAMKMAIQYQAALGRPRRQSFLTIRGGYHGDTFGAMSVCDPVTGMHTLFNRVLPQHYFADSPAIAFSADWDERDIESFRELLEQHHDAIAAVILEPILQGAGGMWFYHPEYLRRVRALCDEYGVLLIADEIATGFGRTGKLFACEHAGISPDIMCLGKALTGGYMTLAATLATRTVAETISNHEPGVFMHGPTFMGNPLACSVALASIRLLQENDWRRLVAALETQMRRELEPCRELGNVVDVRVLGAVGVVELNTPMDMQYAPTAFVSRGVWVRPFGRLVYIMPPYIMEPDDLTKVTRAIYEVVDRNR
ncbi:MAG: adenosylmethionine--8-amino-7-oxononanoate transaminase [Gammaproteobacteria bacterium]